ncbi:zinc ribbon domain-containing protein, partial [Paenibacillus sp. MAH-36]
MRQSYELIIGQATEEQSSNYVSFVGGKPRIPRDINIPKCKLCGSEEAFFFQLAFPTDHAWKDKSMAVFACISCVDEKYFIPPMIKGSLQNAIIPAGFLDEYQVNFNILVF